jgi:hypothetical protein
MAQKVLILGDSGTGKSASLRNFKPEEILVINAAGKPLPFKNHFECITPKFERLTQDVLKAMDATDKKVIVIDDAQYIMSFQYMRRIKENGWDKWNDIQGDFFNIIKACDYMPDDVIVYFLSHIQRDDEGREKIKTMGKMLDEKITIEGLFTTVLKTAVKDGQYFFLTQNSGMDTVKSPIGMFPSYAIDNDLKYVDTKIRNYYEIGEFKDDEAVAQMDQEVKKEDVVKPDAGGRTRRRKKESSVQKTTESEGHGTTDGQGIVSESSPDDGQDNGSAETAAEKPKTRRRKARTVKVDETPAPTENAPETLESAPEEAPTDTPTNTPTDATDTPTDATDTPTDAPKRKRRRKANKLTEADMHTDHTLDITDDELPF